MPKNPLLAFKSVAFDHATKRINYGPTLDGMWLGIDMELRNSAPRVGRTVRLGQIDSTTYKRDYEDVKTKAVQSNRPSAWVGDQKAISTRHQSFTISKIGRYTPAIWRSQEKMVTGLGVPVNYDNVLLSRIAIEDINSFNRRYDHTKPVLRGTQAIRFGELTWCQYVHEVIEINQDKLTHHNEALFRVRPEKNMKQVIYKDNLHSRLLAYVRAYAMETTIRAVTKDSRYKQKIIFYPQNTVYSEKQKALDVALAKSLMQNNASDDWLDCLILFIELKQKDFRNITFRDYQKIYPLIQELGYITNYTIYQKLSPKDQDSVKQKKDAITHQCAFFPKNQGKANGLNHLMTANKNLNDIFDDSHYNDIVKNAGDRYKKHVQHKKTQTSERKKWNGYYNKPFSLNMKKGDIKFDGKSISMYQPALIWNARISPDCKVVEGKNTHPHGNILKWTTCKGVVGKISSVTISYEDDQAKEHKKRYSFLSSLDENKFLLFGNETLEKLDSFDKKAMWKDIYCARISTINPFYLDSIHKELFGSSKSCPSNLTLDQNMLEALWENLVFRRKDKKSRKEKPFNFYIDESTVKTKKILRFFDKAIKHYIQDKNICDLILDKNNGDETFLKTASLFVVLPKHFFKKTKVSTVQEIDDSINVIKKLSNCIKEGKYRPGLADPSAILARFLSMIDIDKSQKSAFFIKLDQMKFASNCLLGSNELVKASYCFYKKYGMQQKMAALKPYDPLLDTQYAKPTAVALVSSAGFFCLAKYGASAAVAGAGVKASIWTATLLTVSGLGAISGGLAIIAALAIGGLLLGAYLGYKYFNHNADDGINMETVSSTYSK